MVKSADKKREKAVIALSMLVLAGMAGEAGAQNINCPQPLVFGSIMACAATNSVTVRPDGTRNVAGCLSAGPGPFSNARCVVTQGFPLKSVVVSVTSPTFTLSGGANTMKINNFNLMTNAGGRTITTTNFAVNVPIGATLGVGASQAQGSYTGSFTVNAVIP